LLGKYAKKITVGTILWFVFVYLLTVVLYFAINQNSVALLRMKHFIVSIW
jgi:hypothetical protein